MLHDSALKFNKTVNKVYLMLTKSSVYLMSCGVKKMNCLLYSVSAPSNISCILIPQSIKTSNSSRQQKGLSMASQRAIVKETVAKECSPPERDQVFLVACFLLFWPKLKVYIMYL